MFRQINVHLTVPAEHSRIQMVLVLMRSLSASPKWEGAVFFSLLSIPVFFFYWGLNWSISSLKPMRRCSPHGTPCWSSKHSGSSETDERKCGTTISYLRPCIDGRSGIVWEQLRIMSGSETCFWCVTAGFKEAAEEVFVALLITSCRYIARAKGGLIIWELLHIFRH